MDNTMSYLKELESWVNEVQGLLGNAKLDDNQSKLWRNQLDELKDEVKRLKAKEVITEKEIISLQNKGKQISNRFMYHNEKRVIAYGEHKLPPLPYEYNALEPYISEEIMRLHHDKHHQSYVDGLNRAEKRLYLEETNKETLKHWLREQAFHGSGHYLHSIFWNNMTPRSTKKPVKEIKRQIEMDFGSWEQFKNKFSDVANSVEGVGWAILFWNPPSNRLGIQSVEKHQLFNIADSIPLLVLDVWEHAYYLQYRTGKDKYIENWWNIVNWNDVNQRLLNAKHL
nr:superoxide dismutase [Oceanobacillus piezotolerans]